MPADHILVLAVDGLRATALGAYGNTSFPTPTLDRLAAESFLFDWCFAESTELPLVYRGLWQSRHPLRELAENQQSPALPAWLAAQGYATTLVSDESEVVALGAEQFDRCLEVAGNTSGRADEVSQTALAQLFGAACKAIEESAAARESDRPQLVWIHSRGMYGPWDAPLDLQASLLDEDDPPPREALDPPDIAIGDADDPDAAFVCSCGYAAQTMVLDTCVEALLAAADDAWPEGQWTLILLGTRGFALGEHRRVGGVDARLHVEQLHVPLLLRMADGKGRLTRGGQLVSHSDFLPTLVDLVGGGAPAVGVDGLSLLPLLIDPRAAWRDAVLASATSGAQAIRTADWSLIRRRDSQRSDEAAAEAELFVRPDDRWEANNVAQLCRAEIKALSAVVDEQARLIAEGLPVERQWLPESQRTPAV